MHKPCAGSHKRPFAVTCSQTDSSACDTQKSKQEVRSSCQSDLAGSGPSNMPNLESVALGEVKCMLRLNECQLLLTVTYNWLISY
jgi:hypothetical protein